MAGARQREEARVDRAAQAQRGGDLPPRGARAGQGRDRQAARGGDARRGDGLDRVFAARPVRVEAEEDANRESQELVVDLLLPGGAPRDDLLEGLAALPLGVLVLGSSQVAVERPERAPLAHGPMPTGPSGAPGWA